MQPQADTHSQFQSGRIPILNHILARGKHADRLSKRGPASCTLLSSTSGVDTCGQADTSPLHSGLVAQVAFLWLCLHCWAALRVSYQSWWLLVAEFLLTTAAMLGIRTGQGRLHWGTTARSSAVKASCWPKLKEACWQDAGPRPCRQMLPALQPVTSLSAAYSVALTRHQLQPQNLSSSTAAVPAHAHPTLLGSQEEELLPVRGGPCLPRRGT